MNEPWWIVKPDGRPIAVGPFMDYWNADAFAKNIFNGNYGYWSLVKTSNPNYRQVTLTSEQLDI